MSAETYRLIRMRELVKIVGLTKSSLYREIAAGRFPKPVRLTENCVAWDSRLVTAWMESRQRVQ
jgi:prophage regulatory protein